MVVQEEFFELLAGVGLRWGGVSHFLGPSDDVSPLAAARSSFCRTSYDFSIFFTRVMYLQGQNW
jgi:hypothetical protein